MPVSRKIRDDGPPVDIQDRILAALSALRPPGINPDWIYSAHELVVDLKVCSRNMLAWWVSHGLKCSPRKGSKKQFFRGKDLEAFMFGDTEVPPLPRRPKKPKAR